MELPARNRYAGAMNAATAILQVPTHLIAGPLGAGKTSVLKHLMRQRPPGEQWAVLVNEFGQVGIDAALLANSTTGVQLAEIPGGCLCCVNGLPFQVGLGRLLRRARPQRLFIEASGLGHPAILMQQLAAAPWQGVLALQPLIMVLDAPRLAAGEPLADAQQQALTGAGLVVLNKSDGLDEATFRMLEQTVGPAPSLFTEHGAVLLEQLPSSAIAEPTATVMPVPDGVPSARALWRGVEDWHRHVQEQNEHTSIGWRIHPGQVFTADAVQHWLSGFPWLRAKGVLHTPAGWQAFNALAGETLRWQHSEWRQDNRVELILSTPDDPQLTASRLEAALQTTVIQPPDNDSRTSQ